MTSLIFFNAYNCFGPHVIYLGISYSVYPFILFYSIVACDNWKGEKNEFLKHLTVN